MTGDQLATIRQALGLSQAQVAKHAGTTQQSISQLERRGAIYKSTADRWATAIVSAVAEVAGQPVTKSEVQSGAGALLIVMKVADQSTKETAGRGR